MNLKSAKVYHDGSHFIAIPSDAFLHRRKKSSRHNLRLKKDELPRSDSPPETTKERFETAYKESLSLPKRERKAHIKSALKDDFADKTRKASLTNFNYFVTFTYSDELHTEETFRKKLANTLKHLVARKGWKYVGVWERGSDTDRLHFHGIFHIPDGSMIGELTEVEDYDTRRHRRQKTLQNTHFLKHFGRNDFKPICHPDDVSSAVKYITKYMEKSGERLVYGGKLPTYFQSDILEDDIACPIGIDDRKALLFDNFTCIDDGTIVGNVSPEVIDQMPKCN